MALKSVMFEETLWLSKKDYNLNFSRLTSRSYFRTYLPGDQDVVGGLYVMCRC